MVSKLDNLQALRGIAALMVCWHHTDVLVNIQNEKEIIASIKGATGVPLFFIISGFIMVFTTRNLSGNPLNNSVEFLTKRIVRIVPLLYFSILVFILMCHKDFIKLWHSEFPLIAFKTALFMPLFNDSVGPFYG
ncbi:MAG TPA: acyltransferase family protein, partial [Ferruginibacter sp.]|nr:acyltransferase family protein [Ferruginibacter sp.]